MTAARSKPVPTLAVATAVALGLASCASPPTREEKAVLVLERMAGAFERHGDDCDALAAELDTVSSDEDALAALSEVDRTDASRRRLAKLQKRIDAATTTIVEHAKKCGADSRVSRSLGAVLGSR